MNTTRVLLVEDEAPKRAHLKNFLLDYFQSIEISEAMSVTSALKFLESALPDLLLLDMSLPTFDIKDQEGGGRPQGFGGTEVLRHMLLAELQCPTIIITGYEAFPRQDGAVDLSQLRSELELEFPKLLHGAFHYNSTYAEWKLELTTSLTELGFPQGDSN